MTSAPRKRRRRKLRRKMRLNHRGHRDHRRFLVILNVLLCALCVLCGLKRHPCRRAFHFALRYSPMSRSPDISSPDTVPVKLNTRNRRCLPVITPQPHFAATDRAIHVARHEIALVRAGKLVAFLPEVRARASRPLRHIRCRVPAAGQIDRRWRRCSRRIAQIFRREDRV